jgi:aryl-alcohol dehydrogenase-like predicted oxidoreductase
MRYLDIDTKKRISKIGLGTWQFGAKEWGYGEDYSQRVAGAIVRRAVELGVTLFDTAETYAAGRSERILGRALGAERESIFLAGKIFPVAPGGPLVRLRAKASAGRLGTSQLDLYQVHYPNPFGGDRAIMNGMRSLQRSGLINEVGVSNYSVPRWCAAERALGGRILSNQVRYSLVDREPENDLLPFALERGRVIIAFSPLAHGLLSGRYHKRNPPTDKVRATSVRFQPETFAQTEKLMEILREVAAAHAATPAQIALAWAIRHPAVAAIPGASSVEQLESNVAAAEIDLAADEDQALRAALPWSGEPGPQRPGLRRKLSMARHCAGGGKNLAKTLWGDFRYGTGFATRLGPGTTDAPLAPHARGGLGASVAAKLAALVTHAARAGPSRPARSMKTMAFIGRPVKSISRTCSRRSAASAPASPRRSMSSSPTTPVNMWPSSMKARPPNIFRSVISASMPATISRMRSARVSL